VLHGGPGTDGRDLLALADIPVHVVAGIR